MLSHISIILLGVQWSYAQTVTGVTLSNYRRRDCSVAGGAEICYSKYPLPDCCGSTSTQYFVSGDCSGCTSTDIHFLFGPGAQGACSVARTGSNNGNCINAQNAKGHGWCRVCGTRVQQLVDEDASEEDWADPFNGISAQPEDEKVCSKPNVVTKDGLRFFRVHYDVPQEVTDMIYEWYDDEENTRFAVGTVPEEFLPYETTSPWE
ncbi:hypothetical protein CB0940_06525 [Cercospora beticola]|uniref:Uncharacterized protein n=1 Tax=Cercospora beticola TaxID=122368 RepID=A0A2G5I1Q1_CERBT|nr:hypothetical protein CB0940_06525 [Cercospora beticola]PIA98453.1 hypothetical protein CB0940_06525 [Cercospora beticola]WPA99163.1 hypothetical protein RHO25_003779 [Cercospora beticola]CAK1360478.1 unnamed protein product [Cercospora beticola]